MDSTQVAEKNVFVVGSVGRVDGWPFMATNEAFKKTGNTGNLAFFTAVQRHLESYTNIDFHSRVGASGDVAVIPCANHIGEHAGNRARYEFCNDFPGSVVAIGLGAQMALGGKAPKLSNDTLAFMEALASKSATGAANIAVRGESTRQVFEKYGLEKSVTVLGCPSLFLNPRRDLGRYIQGRINPEPKKIAIAAGSPNPQGKYGTTEKKLVRLLEKHSGQYIVQHPINSIKLARGEAGQVPEPFIEKYRDAIKPAMPLNRFTRWFERRSRAFFDIDSWIDFLSGYDLLVGTRIHGCMMAIQAGKPALCLVHDSRTKEMCQTMKIPFLEIGKDDLSCLDNGDFGFLAEYDWAGFDANREAIRARYIEFLQTNQVPASPYLAS
ncbi:polysaccharide pyruvyl transferase family protein [Pseudomaricurvus alcaniphilus]|uniref:polysaccharide pyruvyl transferase family protein n=1 Tax=Pseudomaricurvus alcaniphilus TaxID=1166482 RepID=UPI00140A6599|nr:polysaccharide pyruvyl transferase family protein [Pseudomaricurvus alcaniphilus]NHN37608.1 polysaccharide pyruvyl transferase family protein [Pseudomaricurvus alcaniphilus]